jgi:chaperonin cofactor prefoldin
VKKSLIIVLVFTLLSACNLIESTPSIEKLNKAPENVQELLDPAVPLQSINKNGEMTYLIYESKDEVTASLEKQGDKLNIKLKAVPKDGDNIEQHVFKLKIDKKTEMIDVLINGKSTPMGVITGS